MIKHLHTVLFVTYPGFQNRHVHSKALQLPGCCQPRHTPTNDDHLPSLLRCMDRTQNMGNGYYYSVEESIPTHMAISVWMKGTHLVKVWPSCKCQSWWGHAFLGSCVSCGPAQHHLSRKTQYINTQVKPNWPLAIFFQKDEEENTWLELGLNDMGKISHCNNFCRYCNTTSYIKFSSSSIRFRLYISFSCSSNK